MNRHEDESGTANRQSAGFPLRRLLASIGIMSILMTLWLLAASSAVPEGIPSRVVPLRAGIAADARGMVSAGPRRVPANAGCRCRDAP